MLVRVRIRLTKSPLPFTGERDRMIALGAQPSTVMIAAATEHLVHRLQTIPRPSLH